VKLTEADLELAAERLQARFDEEVLASAGLLEQGFGRKARLFLANADFQFFCRFYLAHHFYRPLTAMHKEVCGDLEHLIDDPDVQKEAIAIFRGGGKTTIVSNAFPLWCLLFKKRRYIIIVQNSFEQAKRQLGTIKDELDFNERIKEDFGNEHGDTWAEAEIITNSHVLVQVIGAGSQIRGRKFGNARPDLIILDDMEDLESVQSEAQRSKQWQNLTQSIMPAGDPDRTKLLIVGNYLHYDCMLKKCVESPLFRSRLYRAVPKVNGKYAFSERQDLWDEWKQIFTDRGNERSREDAKAFYISNEQEMMKGVQVTYPTLYPYYALMELWVANGSDVFFTEYLNEPRNPDERFFRYQTHKIEVRQIGDDYVPFFVPWDTRANKGQGGPSGKPPWPIKACQLYGATDPSMGVSDKGDPSAMLIGAMAPDNRMFLMVADIGHKTPYQIIDAQNRYLGEYPIVQWGIETVQFQAFFANEAAEASMRAGTYGNFVPIRTTANKVLRINSLQPDLENGYISIADDGMDELRKQLDEYPNGSKVDGLDALEMVRTLARNNANPDNASTAYFSTHTFDVDREEDRGDEYDTWKEWLLVTEEEQVKARDEKRRAKEIPMPDQPFPFVI
jgi:predicted phage terminase large subunit-like protein